VKELATSNVKHCIQNNEILSLNTRFTRRPEPIK